MKRDMDLVRKLVFAIEDCPGGFPPLDLSIQGYSEEHVGYHLWLMLDAGFIQGDSILDQSGDGPRAIATSSTWAGHEFADASRNEELWTRAKKTVAEKAGSVSIAVFTQYLQELAKSTLGL